MNSASDKSDRATHEPSPTVSAVPVGIPSAAELYRLCDLFTRDDEKYAAYRLRPYHDISDRDWSACVPRDLLRLGLRFMIDHHLAQAIEARPVTK